MKTADDVIREALGPLFVEAVTPKVDVEIVSQDVATRRIDLQVTITFDR